MGFGILRPGCQAVDVVDGGDERGRKRLAARRQLAQQGHQLPFLAGDPFRGNQIEQAGDELLGDAPDSGDPGREVGQ